MKTSLECFSIGHDLLVCPFYVTEISPPNYIAYIGTSVARPPSRPWYHVSLYSGCVVNIAGHLREVVSAVLRQPCTRRSTFLQRSTSIRRGPKARRPGTHRQLRRDARIYGSILVTVEYQPWYRHIRIFLFPANNSVLDSNRRKKKLFRHYISWNTKKTVL